MNKHIRPLTGLRFFAASAVFVHHFISTFYLEFRSFPLGAPAVAFFFVLSGFILTYVYHDRLTTKTLGKFYVSRIARLWPLHLTCLALLLVLVYREHVFGFGTKEWLTLVAHVFLIQTYIPIHDAIFHFNGVAWSISVEVFFYATFPLLLWLQIRPRVIVPIVIFAGTFGMVLLLQEAEKQHWLPAWFDSQSVVHCNPLFRLCEFSLGVWLGQVFIARQEQVVGQRRSFWFDSILEFMVLTGFFAYMIFAFDIWYVHRWFVAADWAGLVVGTWVRFILPFAASAVLIYCFAQTQGCFARLLSHPLMVLLGESSFALYLIHVVVLRRMKISLGPFAEPPLVWHFIIAFGIAIGVSIVLHRLVEIPCKTLIQDLAVRRPRAWSDYFGYLRGRAWQHGSFAFGITLVAVMLVASIQLVSYRPDFEPTVRRIITLSEPSLRNAKFVDEATLCGVTSTAIEDDLEIRFVWRLESTSRRSRLVHVLDNRGETLATYRLENEQLRSLAEGEYYFVDTVMIPQSDLKRAASIAVSFHSPNGKGARLISRSKEAKLGNRLRIIELPIVSLHSVVGDTNLAAG